MKLQCQTRILKKRYQHTPPENNCGISKNISDYSLEILAKLFSELRSSETWQQYAITPGAKI